MSDAPTETPTPRDAGSVPQRDVWTTRAVVVLIGAGFLVTLAITGALLLLEKPTPSQLWVATGTLSGYLGGLLTSISTRVGGSK